MPVYVHGKCLWYSKADLRKCFSLIQKVQKLRNDLNMDKQQKQDPNRSISGEEIQVNAALELGGRKAKHLRASPWIKLRIIENPSFLKDCALLDPEKWRVLRCKIIRFQQ